MAIIDVHFQWSDEKGPCQECGLPAAYDVIDAYGPGRHMRTCCRCAALQAAQGMTIVHLFADTFSDEDLEEVEDD